MAEYEKLTTINQWDDLPHDVRNRWQLLLGCASLPPLIGKLSGSSFGLESYDPQQLGELITSDPVLSGKLLAVANSATFGLVRPMTSVKRAVVHLGLNLTRSIILAYQMEAAFNRVRSYPRKHMEFVRSWGSGTSALSYHIAIIDGSFDPSVAATAGLLSRLGCLILGLGEPKPNIEYQKLSHEIERLEYEQHTWETTSPILGGRLLVHWGVADPLPGWVARGWEPYHLEIERNDTNWALVCIAVASMITSHYLRNPDADPHAALDLAEYAMLKRNLTACQMLSVVGEAMQRSDVRRDLAGACCMIEDDAPTDGRHVLW